MMNNNFIKMAILPFLILLFCATFLNWEPFVESAREQQAKDLPIYVETLKAQNQETVERLAQKLAAHDDIKTLNWSVLAEFSENETTERLRPQQEELRKKIDMDFRAGKSFIWISDAEGKFIAGTPAKSFSILNKLYDEQQEIIKSDGYYQNRDAFLANLIDKYQYMDLNNTTRQRFNYYSRLNEQAPSTWRFHENQKAWSTMLQIDRYQHKQPVLDENGAVIATVNMIYDDSINRHSVYYDAGNRIYHDYGDILTVIITLCGIFLYFLLPAWVYTDATRRGVERPILWSFLVLISHVFGLVIYFIVRPKEELALHCPQCQSEIHESGRYCPYCSADLSTARCHSCQSPVKADWAFCPFCRANLKDDTDVSNIQTIEDMKDINE